MLRKAIVIHVLNICRTPPRATALSDRGREIVVCEKTLRRVMDTFYYMFFKKLEEQTKHSIQLTSHN